MAQVKLGIIGCGIAARTLHWPTLQKLRGEYAVSAVCSHTEEKAKEFAQMLGGVP
jgi:predicted dehydrogenase